jgi:hypothetical protein
MKYKALPLQKHKIYLDDVAFIRRLAAARGEYHGDALMRHATEQAKALERQVKNAATPMSAGERENAKRRLQHLAEMMAEHVAQAPASTAPQTPWRPGTQTPSAQTPLYASRAPPSRATPKRGPAPMTPLRR